MFTLPSPPFLIHVPSCVHEICRFCAEKLQSLCSGLVCVRLDKLSALYYIILGSLRQDVLLCLTHACLVMSHSREPYKYIRSPGGTRFWFFPFSPSYVGIPSLSYHAGVLTSRERRSLEHTKPLGPADPPFVYRDSDHKKFQFLRYRQKFPNILGYSNNINDSLHNLKFWQEEPWRYEKYMAIKKFIDDIRADRFGFVCPPSTLVKTLMADGSHQVKLQ